MAYYHQRQGYRNNHWQKFNRERTLTQDSSASSLASTSSHHHHHHHQPSRQHSQNWSESNGTSFQQSSPKMGQEFPHTPSNLASGQKDLEVLERLKDSIINNQHECFRSAPQPAALAKIYMGNIRISPVPPHPEQIPTAHDPARKGVSSGDNQRRGRASSIDSWESRKQVRLP